MSRLRFATAQALLDTYPEVAQKIASAPTDQLPVDFLKALSSAGRFADALTFCAFLLPRREAVWWACRCIRTLSAEFAPERAAGLLAAEAWVYEPDEEHRQAALDLGSKGESKNPMTWLALAAGWSGGFVAGTAQKPVQVPQYMTARAVRIAVLSSAQKLPRELRRSRFQQCILEGIKLAEFGL